MEAGSAPAIEVERLRAGYGATIVVDGVDLSVAPGEFVAILGSSGCGKTTLLRTIAGFQKASAGRVRSFGRDMTDLPPERRDVAMVFQSYALWPHMTVLGNIGYGLRLRRKPREEIRTRVGTILAMLNMSGLEDRKVTDLSGGQRQRVALGRALAVEPRLLLLDEPLSNLDAKVRLQLRAEIKALQSRLGFAVLHVTHDREEAMTMADRIVVMDQGRIAQVGAPEEVYHRPNSPFVATFMGADNTIALKIGEGPSGKRVEAGPHHAAAPIQERDRGRADDCVFPRRRRAHRKPGAPRRRRDHAAGQGHAAVISGWSLPLRGGGGDQRIHGPRRAAVRGGNAGRPVPAGRGAASVSRPNTDRPAKQTDRPRGGNMRNLIAASVLAIGARRRQRQRPDHQCRDRRRPEHGRLRARLSRAAVREEASRREGGRGRHRAGRWRVAEDLREARRAEGRERRAPGTST